MTYGSGGPYTRYGWYRRDRRYRPRRGVRRTVAAAALLVAVTACTHAPPDEPAAPPPGDGVLRIVTGSDLTSTGIRRELIEKAAEATGIDDISIVELPDDADRQRSQLVAALQAGNKDAYDIVNLDVTWTAEFAEQELIEPLEGPLSELDRRDAKYIWPSVRETVTYEGKAWAVPWNTDVGLLYYRADRFGSDPRLRTWRDLTRAVADGADARDQVGMVTQLAPYEGLTVNTYEAVWRNGGEIIDEEGRVRVAEDEARGGLLELASAFSTSGGLPLLDKEWTSSDESGSIERFLAGEAPTMRNWPFAKSRLQEHAGKSSGGEGAPRFGVTALPGAEDGTAGSAALGGQNLAIAEGSPDQAEAEKLIAWLTSAAAGEELYEGGFVPARQDSLPDDCARGGRALPERVPQGSLDEQFLEALCWSMEHARARPVTPYYAAVTQDIQDVMAKQLRAAPTGPPVDSRASPEDLRDRLRASLDGR
ncbi:extracellular solute-binding protein [Streptomyces sp. N2-109]|uniref:Extracellular solute-binding protein n=1 Tax=Streptomyces gossypii TaxID=2883101 RepID=A0ABT2JR99_9ACTN|nr:extracellular solute-binding protein [Streptomyces gossypii]MCT2590417.1 extracellular solute-binding protein [Streptomyces gossypii]